MGFLGWGRGGRHFGSCGGDGGGGAVVVVVGGGGGTLEHYPPHRLGPPRACAEGKCCG